MSFRTWLFAVTIGLIASLGQAQEQAGGEQGQSAAQENPAQPFPVPLLVDIIEDEATAEARNRSEEESRQREIEDLIAQQGMNAATQSIEAATKDMRDYSLYSTLFVGIGTVLLFVTLWITWQANRVARDAVNQGGKATFAAFEAVETAKEANKIMREDQRGWAKVIFEVGETVFKEDRITTDVFFFPQNVGLKPILDVRLSFRQVDPTLKNQIEKQSLLAEIARDVHNFGVPTDEVIFPNESGAGFVPSIEVARGEQGKGPIWLVCAASYQIQAGGENKTTVATLEIHISPTDGERSFASVNSLDAMRLNTRRVGFGLVT